MQKPAGILLSLAIQVLLATGACRAQSSQEHKIDNNDRTRAEIMLQDMHGALKKFYYDPTFHGIDVDARYEAYLERLKKATTIGDAFRTIAAYLAGLDDSHTFFIPPRRSYRMEYGYRMQIVGDACYITQVRPETDALQKLHIGDQVEALDGFSVNRKDSWQLEYFLNELAPKATSEFTLRAPSGMLRKEQVLTKFIQGKRLKDLTFDQGGNDIYNLMFERDKEMHLLRDRYSEQGDALIWKMAAFIQGDDAVDRMIGLARRHKSLVLDLRENSGGYETTLTRMIGSFFDHDVKIGTKVTRKGKKLLTAKSRGHNAFTGELVVLVDSKSASAAEIFARVIQLQHRGQVVGDRSSGSVMEAFGYPFQAGADIAVFYAASITAADLLMEDGKSLEKAGVTPDVIVLPAASQLANGQDPALAKAASIVGINLDPTAAGKLFPFEWTPLQ